MADLIDIHSRQVQRTEVAELPHSPQAEQAVLGGLMLDNSKWEAVADLITAADFHVEEHRVIFDAIARMAGGGEPVDVVTLSEFLERNDTLPDAGGMPYIGQLANDTPSANNVTSYAGIVRKHARSRRLVADFRLLAAKAAKGTDPAATLLQEAEKRLADAADSDTRDVGLVGPADLVKATVAYMDEQHSRKDGLSGLSTGFADLDELTGGLKPGELSVIAARPAMGKTTLAMNIAQTVAIREGRPVAVFSLEMPKEALMLRALASLGTLDLKALMSGKLDGGDWVRVTSTINILSQSGLYIDDHAAITPAQIAARCRQLKRAAGDLALVVVDYIQLVDPGRRADTRTLEVAYISRALKIAAKDLGVPVIALSQLNRDAEKRHNNRPQLSDLRDSGAIEQDADLVAFVYRDEVYNEDSPDKGTAEIIIAKNRNGPTGTVRLVFQGQYTRFANLAFDPMFPQQR